MITMFRRRAPTCLISAIVGLAALNGPAWAEAPAKEAYALLRGQKQIDGYRHMENTFRTRVVKKGRTVRPLPQAAQQIQPRYVLGNEEGDIETFMKLNRSAGVVVIRNGKIVLEKYALGQKATDRWTSFSVAKSINATLVGAALADGAITSLEDPVTKYVPELTGSAYDGVKISDALKMRGGLTWDENFSDPNSDIAKFSKIIDEDGSLIPLLRSLRRVAPINTKFHYNTGEASLLGLVVQRATGKSEADYLSQKVWAPYGMERDAIWVVTGGNEVSGCCIGATLRDYGRFGMFIMGGGVARGKHVLPATWPQDSIRSYTPNAYGAIGYGYQWWPHPNGAFEAIGIYGQSIYINPALQLVIVSSSAWPEPDWQEGYRRNHAFFEAVEKSLPK